MYNIQKLAPYIQKYNTIIGTSNLEVSVRAMMAGITANTKIALDGQIKELLFVGGRKKPRSPLRDQSVTEIVTPQTSNDEDIYIESIITVVNRYFKGINVAKSENKVKAILVKLLSNNVTGFYDKFNLPMSYQDQLGCVFSDLMAASQKCIERFVEVIESQEYLLKKLPPRFEYKSLNANSIYKEYLADFDCATEGSDKEAIAKFMSDISLVESDDSESNIEVDSDDQDIEMTQEQIIEAIPDVIRKFGYAKTLQARSDKFVASKFARLKDDKIKANLLKIISSFHSTYIRLTSNVFSDSYRQMFGLSPTTYKENKSRVIKEIATISNSEEFLQFKRMLLE